MRRALLLVLLAVVVVAPSGSSAVSSRRTAVNPRPLTIPALRIWHGSRGVFRLRRTSRVVVAGGYWRALRGTARLFASELRLRVRRGLGGRGDIVLALGARDRRLGREGYSLHVGRRVVVRGRDATGVFYGTRTLLQLLHQRRVIGRGRALDWPQYPQRGLMLDLGRRTYPFAWLQDRVRELAYLKMNLLHLHLTDDQRWGIQSDTHPEIVSPGALTKAQLRSLLALAGRYHVTVVPEIDMPAHLGALLDKHPDLELKAAGATKPPSTPESRKLDITNPAALRIVQQLLDEYLPLFPGPCWHMGADEYFSPEDQALYPQLDAYAVSRYGSRANYKDAILAFINQVDGIVRSHHKSLRTWHDELGAGGVLRANADIVAEWWIDFSPLSEPRPPKPQQLLSDGHRVLNAGWFPTYYTEDLGPVQGKPSMQKAYESWSVNQFCSPTQNDQFFEPCDVVSASDPHAGGKLMFLAGLGAGFVLGTRAGREKYDELVQAARKVRENPTVQEAAAVVATDPSVLASRGWRERPGSTSPHAPARAADRGPGSAPMSRPPPPGRHERSAHRARQ